MVNGKKNMLAAESLVLATAAEASFWLSKLQGALQKSISNLKRSYLKKYEINSNKIFMVVRIFHCLHLEVFID